jgi:hypothetical protein
MSDGHGYIDSSIPEEADAKPISYPWVKLSPNEHGDLYDDVQGMSQPRSQPEEPKKPQPLPLLVKRCCEHPQDDSGFYPFGGVGGEW